MLNCLLVLVLLLQVEVVCPVTNTVAGEGHRPQSDVSLGADSPPVFRGREPHLREVGHDQRIA